MSRWSEIRDYIRFDEADETALRANLAIVKPHFGRIIDEFYARILEHEGARRVLSGDPAQIGRLKDSLGGWLESCFTGPFDDAYFESHARIGRVHVWIGLEPRYMVLAMNLIRCGLEKAVFEALGGDPEVLFPRVRAIARVCDAELAVMLETYGEEYSTQLRRRERLAAIGQIGASVSHEVKNPLGVIASSVYALKEYCETRLDERAAKHLDRIERNVDQANRIVTTLLDYLKGKAPARVETDWNRLVAEAAGDLHLPPGVEVAFRLAGDAGRADLDPVQVSRIIANLVQNAAEAMPEGGLITVETRGEPEAIEVVVRDQGPGLPSSMLPQLFEPLVTTKAVGTGLGLALSKAIVEAHQGSIQAANAEAGGALFRVRLPRHAPERQPTEEVRRP